MSENVSLALSIYSIVLSTLVGLRMWWQARRRFGDALVTELRNGEWYE